MNPSNVSRSCLWIAWSLALSGCAGNGKTAATDPPAQSADVALTRLPTGVELDPAGRSIPLGNMPLGALETADHRHVVVSLSGWREQGIQVIDLAAGRVIERIPQRGAFLGLAWSADAHTLYVSGGSAEVVYTYAWNDAATPFATPADSIVLAEPKAASRYPAGLALSADGRFLYVAENLADSLAVIELVSRRVVQRLGVGPYPYAVAASTDGRVYVSAWGSDFIATFESDDSGHLHARHAIDAGRHPSALLLSANGRRLFATTASTDRIAVIDTRASRVVRFLCDAPPGGVMEGCTPNALALSSDGRRLFVAEADANAVAVFELSAESCGDSAATGDDRLSGRIPVEWYPSAVIASGDSLCVVNGKGRGTAPNTTRGHPGEKNRDRRAYTLGQLNGTVCMVPAARGAALEPLTRRVAASNHWDTTTTGASARYPPFKHVIYIIKENRTFDQVFGDLAQADGDTTYLFFGRSITPNHHALAERFGIFDRFFVNAEVSAQGHPWSTAAYVTDFLEKTTPDVYRRGRAERDDQGDADDPAAGYLWDAAIRKGLTLRNYGEFGEAVPEDDTGPARTRATVASLDPYTHPTYPPYDLSIPDQKRADVWLEELRASEQSGEMPALQILHLPNDHTSGALAGRPTPKAAVADNDLALGRIIEALSRSRFWKDTAVFVVQDDAQDGPDHIDSHRSLLLVVSAWNRGGVLHRFVNTTDVVATMEEILGLEPMSQFDRFGRPLREIWDDDANLDPYQALEPAQSLAEMNVAVNSDAHASQAMDLTRADRIDDDAFNRILWRMLKGRAGPYPGSRRASLQEYARSR